MRTIIDLPEQQRRDLDALCARQNISRAEAVRRAVTLLIATDRAPFPEDDPAFGSWDGPPADEYLAEIRGEWAERERRLGLQ